MVTHCSDLLNIISVGLRISCHVSLSIPTKNSSGFRIFSEGIGKGQWYEIN